MKIVKLNTKAPGKSQCIKAKSPQIGPLVEDLDQEKHFSTEQTRTTSYELELEDDLSNLREFWGAISHGAKEVLDTIFKLSESGNLDYKHLEQLNAQARRHGMDFDYGLDAEPYEFRTNVKIQL